MKDEKDAEVLTYFFESAVKILSISEFSSTSPLPDSFFLFNFESSNKT